MLGGHSRRSAVALVQVVVRVIAVYKSYLDSPIGIWKALLGVSCIERIIKDVMVRNSASGGEPKRRRKEPGKRLNTGSEEHQPSIDTVIEDIDPAEFGYRRLQGRFSNDRRP